MTAKQILYCNNCDNRFYDDFNSDKICKHCNTKNYEDVEILEPHELNSCSCKQCKQIQAVA